MKGGVCRDYLDWSGEIDLEVTSLSGGYMSSGGLPPQVNEYSQGCLGDSVFFCCVSSGVPDEMVHVS